METVVLVVSGRRNNVNAFSVITILIFIVLIIHPFSSSLVLGCFRTTVACLNVQSFIRLKNL